MSSPDTCSSASSIGTGVLVGPIPELLPRCVTERGLSAVFDCALVSSHCLGKAATMQYSEIFSLISGAE